jgi:cyclopropane-fatty-acyl-phospholipid synthase
MTSSASSPPDRVRGVAASRAAASDPLVVRVLKRRLAHPGAPTFDLETPDGAVHRLGAGPVPSFHVWIRNASAVRALASLDEPSIGEAYMNGDLDFAGDFLAALDLRKFLSDSHWLHSVWRFVQPLVFGRVASDKRWVGQHYDYGDDFYFAFLDRRFKLYSQALFESDDQSLEDAAENKLAYIVRACRLGPGRHVLDVGGGWGSFAGYAAARGANVTMLTISPAQYAYLTQWCGAHEPPGRLDAVYEDIFAYAPGRQYDAIVLLGVMEHLPDYRRLFAKFDELLRPNGRLYMDFAAGRKKFHVSSFTYRYVFPGDHTPVVVPDLLAAANATRFEPIAIHNDRHAYYLTLQAWARNLEAARDELARRFGERTYRLFQMYLWGGAHQMQRDGTLESYRMVFQKSLGSPSSEIGLDRN